MDRPGTDEAGTDETPACSIARSLEILGDRWSILILRDAFRGIRRFDDFRRDLDIARPVLADRLRRLVESGVMTKVPYQEHPPRFEYRLTHMGIELSPILVALMRWGDRYLSGDGGPPTVLVHEPCGHTLQQGFWCPSCHQTFSPTDIASRPGPGADHRPSARPRPERAGGRRGRAAGSTAS
ncbi:MAG TPA: helix-turn-helix domain-containing protein [Microthrixaceae bacterium]|nr:helix-turn-helix domain-containing protein [Microthrixaceae bacterium]